MAQTLLAQSRWLCNHDWQCIGALSVYAAWNMRQASGEGAHQTGLVERSRRSQSRDAAGRHLACGTLSWCRWRHCCVWRGSLGSPDTCSWSTSCLHMWSPLLKHEETMRRRIINYINENTFWLMYTTGRRRKREGTIQGNIIEVQTAAVSGFLLQMFWATIVHWQLAGETE